MKIKQNKLGTYFAVTAGVGCVSVANGAIQVVDLSGLSDSLSPSNLVPTVTLAFPTETGDSFIDLAFATASSNNSGGLTNVSITGGGNSAFYSNNLVTSGKFSFFTTVGYSSTDTAPFPSNVSQLGGATWNNGGIAQDTFSIGENWVPFRDTAGNFGWFSFTLSSLEINSEGPLESFGSFVYDDESTSPATAIDLQTAVTAVNSVPEPSSLALLALGSAGLAARRKRKAVSAALSN